MPLWLGSKQCVMVTMIEVFFPPVMSAELKRAFSEAKHMVSRH